MSEICIKGGHITRRTLTCTIHAFINVIHAINFNWYACVDVWHAITRTWHACVAVRHVIHYDTHNISVLGGTNLAVFKCKSSGFPSFLWGFLWAWDTLLSIWRTNYWFPLLSSDCFLFLVLPGCLWCAVWVCRSRWILFTDGLILWHRLLVLCILIPSADGWGARGICDIDRVRSFCGWAFGYVRWDFPGGVVFLQWWPIDNDRPLWRH